MKFHMKLCRSDFVFEFCHESPGVCMLAYGAKVARQKQKKLRQFLIETHDHVREDTNREQKEKGRCKRLHERVFN